MAGFLLRKGRRFLVCGGVVTDLLGLVLAARVFWRQRRQVFEGRPRGFGGVLVVCQWRAADEEVEWFDGGRAGDGAFCDGGGALALGDGVLYARALVVSSSFEAIFAAVSFRGVFVEGFVKAILSAGSFDANVSAGCF